MQIQHIELDLSRKKLRSNFETQLKSCVQKSDAIKQKKTQTTLHHDERHYRAKYFLA